MVYGPMEIFRTHKRDIPRIVASYFLREENTEYQFSDNNLALIEESLILIFSIIKVLTLPCYVSLTVIYVT